ncbi:hypothetical protein B4U80_08429 [Leptotrombidium deliense]|uniref:Uncharacterized protein n=1 Tax=Leptotrombidium deliense TaxID=299467 RepID=A0A443SI76_9ACAR|nr:hypothetical protein B4U80_08429 [Leptotrombidium deliense]
MVDCDHYNREYSIHDLHLLLVFQRHQQRTQLPTHCLDRCWSSHLRRRTLWGT